MHLQGNGRVVDGARHVLDTLEMDDRPLLTCGSFGMMARHITAVRLIANSHRLYFV